MSGAKATDHHTGIVKERRESRNDNSRGDLEKLEKGLRSYKSQEGWTGKSHVARPRKDSHDLIVKRRQRRFKLLLHG